MKEKQMCNDKKLCKKRFDMLIDVLQFSISTLLNSIMVTVTVIAFSLYVIFDGNLTNMLTDLLALGDEKIKDVFKVLFVPILFFQFAFRGYNFISFRKSLEEYNSTYEKVKTGTCRKITSEPIIQESVNFEERLKEAYIRKHIVITGETGTGKTTRLKDVDMYVREDTLSSYGATALWSKLAGIKYLILDSKTDIATKNKLELEYKNVLSKIDKKNPNWCNDVSKLNDTQTQATIKSTNAKAEVGTKPNAQVTTDFVGAEKSLQKLDRSKPSSAFKPIN